ncbi:MAG TPA: hypothetical protein VF157_03570 [Chloroflexota bacterium]
MGTLRSTLRLTPLARFGAILHAFQHTGSIYFGHARAGAGSIVFGAGLWRFLETAFIVFMAIGALSGLSYLYKPIMKLIKRRAKEK